MNFKSFFIQGFFLLCLCIPVFSQGYEIKISINSRNDTVLLGHFFARNDRFIVNDTVILNRVGVGVFKGKEKLRKGMYSLVSNKQRIFDFIVGDEQTFEIFADTTDLVGKAKATKSRDNEIYFDFQRMNRRTGMRQYELQQRLQTADSTTKIEIYKDLQMLNINRANELWNMIGDTQGLFIHKYLNSQFPVFMRVPSTNPQIWQASLPENAETWSRDSLNRYQYQWYRSNFFSDFNIFDPDMLRMPSYEEKLMEYITKVIPQITDSICMEIDKILKKAQENDEVFNCILVSLYNHYSKMLEVIVDKGIVPENIWVHLVEKWYIPFAHWSSDDFIKQRKKDVADRKHNLIGHMAPPMVMLMSLPPEHFKAAAKDTAIKFDLHAGKMIQDFRKELKSKYTVLYFWDYTCGHCKRGIQDLFHAWEELKDNGLQVITVQTYLTDRKDKGKWLDFVNENNMFGQGWFNAWSPYDNKFRDLYNTTNVPVMYLLDENYTIILKRISAEHLKDIIGK